MADWAGIDHDLLIEIAERLPSTESYKCFGAVCRSWAAAAAEGHLNQTTFEVPWLMLAEKEEEESSEREFTSVLGNNKNTRKIFLPEASKKRCLSCKDWLFIVEQDEIRASLFHPLSRIQVHLPKLNTFSLYDSMVSYNLHFIEKVVLSANPTTTSTSSDDCIVMVIWGRRRHLAFCRPGDTSWTPIDEWDAQISDIVYCNNKLYALDRESRVLTCDIHGPNPTQLHQVFFALPPVIVFNLYLVEFSGKFLIVHRDIDIQASYKTEEFKVFEVNIEDGTWVEVKDLGNKALFLGYNSSCFIECSEFNNCKPNYIYFSDDNMELYLYLSSLMEGCTGGGKDMGIYHLSDGSIGPLFDDDREIVCSKFTPPTWIGPSF